MSGKVLWLNVLLVLLWSAEAVGLPSNFSLEGRTILVQGQGIKTAATKSDPTQTFFNATLNAEGVGKTYALRVEGLTPEDDCHLYINGKPLEIVPLIAPDGHWYTIPEGRFTEGSNTVKLTSCTGAPIANTEMLGFSIDFAEEEHLPKLVLPAAAPPPIWSNQTEYDVQHMDIAVTLSTSAATIPAGEVTITAKSLVPGLTQCVLDFNDSGGNMSITGVDAGPATSALTYNWLTIDNKLVITLGSAVAQDDEFTVRVFYNGTPTSGRGLRRSTHSGVPVLFTYNQSYDARYWMPSKDLPEDKFTCDMRVTVPTVSYSGYPFSVVSNGTLISTTDNGGSATYHWKEDYPIQTQYVSIAATNYRVAADTYLGLDDVTTMSVAHHVYPESYASEAPELTRTIEVLEWMADTFGEYPFLDEKYVTATWAYGGGLEHQTCTSMPNGNLATPYHRRNIHELAHMWFGVCVGNETFDHLWISEGWASYVEALWREHKNGVADGKVRMAEYRASSSDSVPIVSSTADSFTFGVTYYKGAWVLHMLRRVMGDSAFFQATKNYLTDPALRYGTAVSSDFQEHVEAEHGSNMDWFFDQWLYRTSRPSYEWVWAARHDSSTWWVDITINQTQGDTHYVMPIDFRVNFINATNSTITVNNTQRLQTFSVNVGAVQPMTMTFDPDAWLLYGAAQNMSGTPPSPPALKSVIGDGNAGTATIAWEPSPSSFVLGYRIYQSTDGISNWVRIQDENLLGAGATSAVVTGLSKDDTYYYAVVAIGGAESGLTDVYGTRIGADAGLVLIVDAYDRGSNNHNYAAALGRGVAAHTNPFDTIANEVVGNSIILGNYSVVMWNCAEESTAHETFSNSEQGLVSTYLQNGGKLFVSGNEIGWDLGRFAGTDRDFFNDYLKAAYVADDSNDYTVSGSGSCFAGRVFSFGSGDAPYTPQFPDVIAAVNGGSVALEYSPGIVAAIEFEGMFPGGTEEGALVYVGFAFETLASEAQRLQMVSDVLDYFDIPLPVEVSRWSLE